MIIIIITFVLKFVSIPTTEGKKWAGEGINFMRKIVTIRFFCVVL